MRIVQLKRILVPTDFSEYAGVATEYACSLADKFDAELHVLHVFECYTGSKYVPGVPLPTAGTWPQELVQRVAESLVNLIDADWVEKHRVVHATRVGHPVVEIIDNAKNEAMELIVMGTQGRSGVTHLLIGSVAEKVVRKAPCAVLTVRPT
jgi:nucleotide-binding universal stress UspA family protein